MTAPHPTTANCQSTTANCQSTIANRRQLPPDNQRPDGPRNSLKWKLSEVVPDPWRGPEGHFWTILGLFRPVFSRFQPSWPILAQSPPSGSGDGDGVQQGPKTGRTGPLPKVAPDPLGGPNGPFGAILGPFWARSTAIPDTEYWTPDSPNPKLVPGVLGVVPSILGVVPRVLRVVPRVLGGGGPQGTRGGPLGTRGGPRVLGGGPQGTRGGPHGTREWSPGY